MSEKPQNAFVRFFKALGRALATFLMSLIFIVAYIILWPFTRCKVKGKENLRDDDEASVFIANHYELYGPVSVFYNFPFKFRPWIIDKMMDPESIEHQMGLMIYNNYKYVPKFLKKFMLKCIKSFVVFIMNNIAHGLPISRENPRSNLETLKKSSEILESKNCIVIWPEVLYVKEGVGEFQTGFEHLAKYHYKKTGKKISFYPMFISKKNRSMYIGEPIIFDPAKDENSQKAEIIEYLHDYMEMQYKTFEKHEPTKKPKT